MTARARHDRQPLPPSLYAATMRPGIETPRLESSHRTDVAIIGGGYTGLSTALHLAEAGVGVTVLEANEPGWGASGRNGGQINPGLKPDPDQVESDFGPELGGRMVRFAWGAAASTFELIRRHNIECDARQNGTLRAAYHPTNADAVRRSADQAMRRGLPVTLLEGEKIRTATGTGRYLAIMRDATGGDVHPLDYARGLARAAIGAGARIHGDTPAIDLRRSGGRWEVQTATGIVSADQVVLGTNGYTDGLYPELKRSVVPVYSSIAASEPLPPEVAASVMPSRSSLYESGNITVYLRVDREGRLLIGGRGPQRPIADPSPVAYLTRYAAKLWPQIAGIAWTYGWNGQLAMTTDHYPHIHQPMPGLTAYLGCNGRGVAMATVMGGEIARLARGAKPSELAMPVSAIRTVPFHSFWRAGVAIKVFEGRLRDRLGM